MPSQSSRSFLAAPANAGQAAHIGLRNVRRSSSLTYQVADEISAMILQQGLHPGDALPAMRQLEQECGVGHGVMREALRILETRGLVQIQHGKRAIVSARSAEALGVSMGTVFRLHEGKLGDLMEFRRILETQVAGLAAARRSQEDLAGLKACLDAFGGPPILHEVYAGADVDFHNALVAATRNPILISLMSSIQRLLIESREKTFRGPEEGVERARRAHQRIYERVAAGDVAGAEEAMRVHLRETQEDIDLAIRQGRLRPEL